MNPFSGKMTIAQQRIVNEAGEQGLIMIDTRGLPKFDGSKIYNACACMGELVGPPDFKKLRTVRLSSIESMLENGIIMVVRITLAVAITNLYQIECRVTPAALEYIRKNEGDRNVKNR